MKLDTVIPDPVYHLISMSKLIKYTKSRHPNATDEEIIKIVNELNASQPIIMGKPVKVVE